MSGIDVEEIEAMIDDCLKRESKLSGWEANFINDLSQKNPLHFSDKVLMALENIWERIT